MLFWIGERTAGVVDRMGDFRVETRFLHVWFLPVLPLGSVAVVDGERHDIPWHGESITAGYLRTWAPVLLLGALAAAISRPAGAPFELWALLVVLIAIAWIVSMGLGELPPAERALRAAYARHLGVPLDPAATGTDLVALRDRLAGVIVAALPGRPTAYRIGAGPTEDWADELCAIDAEDDIIAAGVTRARVEELLGDRAARARWRRLRSALLRRYVERHPKLLEESVVG
jgi:hypothetical protein